MTIKTDDLALNEITTYLLQSIKKVFNEELICLLIHGSFVKGGLTRDFSDIDVQVFVKETAFDEFGLKLKKSLKMQELVGTLDFSKIGASYLQMYFYDPKKMPDWYTPPMHGTYQILFGDLPEELDYNTENFKLKMVNSLKRLRNIISDLVRNFTDSSNSQILRRTRYVATVVYPTMYSLLAYNKTEPGEIWIKPKDKVLEMFCEEFAEDEINMYLVQFFDSVKILAKNREDYEITRTTFKMGINFLMKAAKLSDEI
ncbi:hypothetical protein ES703_112361 [subsurface metagenome]